MGSRSRTTARPGRGISRRRLIAGGAVLAAAAAIAGRIWQVNANAFDYPERHYAMGEWVDLDGAFTTYANENTQGYSLCVQDAQIMTRAEYIERYALDPSQVEPTDYDDVPSVLCLTLAIKNEGSDSGGFYIYDATLVPEGEIRSMGYQASLWGTSNELIDDSVYSFSLLRDSEYTAQIPYILYAAPGEDFQHAIRAKRFSFIVSNAPVRNVIDIEVA